MEKMKVAARKITLGATLGLALGGAYGTGALAEEGSQRDWSYSGFQFAGPERWGDVRAEYGLCKTGQLQTPVNISTASASKAPLPAIEFQYAPTFLRVVNTGHTTQVNVEKGRQIVVGGETYALIQYHFHAPSEEQIDGKSFAMVAHLVHQSASGKLAVVAVLFELGTYNPDLASLWARFPRIVGNEIAFPNVRLDITKILPADRSYYTYEGSLNMPPCTEGVTWFVLKQPLTASAGQIREFTAQHSVNARPVQPLNGRQVRVSQ
ncbi:MAG: carbonate dehydratase [Betaproteobacteria bacterium]|jgi:carbonic anhydrase|nr:carbonate dehydratase [Betaproteobacteria bacterium]